VTLRAKPGLSPLGVSGFADIGVVGDYDRSRPPRAGDRTLTFEAVRA
jgi:hypothetical protein